MIRISGKLPKAKWQKRTDIAKVSHWVLEGGEMPFKKETMLKCLEQLEKHTLKAKEEMKPTAKIEMLRDSDFIAPRMDDGSGNQIVDTRDLKLEELAIKINEIIEELNETKNE